MSYDCRTDKLLMPHEHTIADYVCVLLITLRCPQKPQRDSSWAGAQVTSCRARSLQPLLCPRRGMQLGLRNRPTARHDIPEKGWGPHMNNRNCVQMHRADGCH